MSSLHSGSQCLNASGSLQIEGRRPASWKHWLAGACMWCYASAIAFAANGLEILDPIRKAAYSEMETAETDASAKRIELSQKYVAALTALEKTLTAAGQLDPIIHVREEREAVLKNGGTTSHPDKALVELRGKYLKSVEAIDAGLKTMRTKVVADTSAKIRGQETALTKAGNVDAALELRKEGQKLILDLSNGTGEAADAIPFSEDPRVADVPAAGAIKDLEVIVIPDEKPFENPLENPFANKDRWLEPLTVPVSKQKIREAIIIGDRAKHKSPLVVISPGSVWSGAERGRIELSAGNLVASKCRFDALELGADLSSKFHFLNCAFTNCVFKKAGVWYGEEVAGKFYFENCHIKGQFGEGLNVVDNGFRMQNSVLEEIEFPSFAFGKRQPADYLNNKWLRLVHCRFVKCKIPVSFLLITRDCLFENCTFINDAEKSKDVPVTKPLEITLYVNNCKSRITGLPDTIKLTEKPYGDLKGIAIPTATSITAQMTK